MPSEKAIGSPIAKSTSSSTIITNPEVRGSTITPYLPSTVAFGAEPSFVVRLIKTFKNSVPMSIRNCTQSKPEPKAAKIFPGQTGNFFTPQRFSPIFTEFMASSVPPIVIAKNRTKAIAQQMILSAFRMVGLVLEMMTSTRTWPRCDCVQASPRNTIADMSSMLSSSVPWRGLLKKNLPMLSGTIVHTMTKIQQLAAMPAVYLTAL